MRITHAVLSSALLFPARLPAQPVITAVVNAAWAQAGVPRGCLISIFGSKLASDTLTAGILPLPKRLAGTVVTVGDLELEAPLYYVSPGQINAQLPFEALGTKLPIFVTTAEGKSAPFVLTPSLAGAGLFTLTGDGKGAALVLDGAFRPMTTAQAGKPIIFYATGLGPTDPPALSGAPGASSEPLNRVVNVPDVFIGESPARVDFAGLAPGLAGVYQLNVVPQQLATDRMYIRSQGRTSNIVSVGRLAGGANVGNASGTIQALYPTTDPMAFPVAYSPLMIGAKFTARMDILPTAGPFVIAAVSDAATSIITVDPANGTFDGSVTLPTAASRAGDFSDAEFQAIDLLTCDSGGNCQPFPGNIIPASRLDPFALMALNGLPLPNTPVPHNSTGLLKVHGTVRPGTEFVIDGQNNSSLSVFVGYLVIPVPAKSGTTTLRLFVDGNQVASTDVAYQLPGFLGGTGR